jgi:rhodanese-related sulfurtransferase
MTKQISTRTLYDRLGLQDAPLILDIRPSEALATFPRLIPGAHHVDGHDSTLWMHRVPIHRPIALYSSRGHDLALVATALAAHGARISVVQGGVEEWVADGLPTVKARTHLGVPGRSQWVTRERPKIDRLACPWLIRRFIDPHAMFFYAPATQVRAQAQSLNAQPYDIPDVTFSHRGDHCSFDAFLAEFELHDPVLDDLAKIVRAADTGTLDMSREAPGLLAISLGLSASIRDDQVLLEQAMTVYDALYTWCKTARSESHSWPTPSPHLPA